jgi:adenine phosphoribosyltransferase
MSSSLKNLSEDHQDAPQAGSKSRQSPTNASPTAQLTSLKIRLKSSLRQFPDFPTKGILFEDIFPIFRKADRLADLITALELLTLEENGGPGKPDIIVGLDARGFLIGPALALRLGVGFVPVRKRGKLPGPTENATYKKEYGEDIFEIQSDSIQPGEKVIVLDDIIATGMC